MLNTPQQTPVYSENLTEHVVTYKNGVKLIKYTNPAYCEGYGLNLDKQEDTNSKLKGTKRKPAHY